jgi:hypothetical protein
MAVPGWGSLFFRRSRPSGLHRISCYLSSDSLLQIAKAGCQVLSFFWKGPADHRHLSLQTFPLSAIPHSRLLWHSNNSSPFREISSPQSPSPGTNFPLTNQRYCYHGNGQSWRPDNVPFCWLLLFDNLDGHVACACDDWNVNSLEFPETGRHLVLRPNSLIPGIFHLTH